MKIPEPKKLKSGTWFIQLRLTSADGSLVSVPVSAPTKKECVRRAELIKAEHRSGKRSASKSELTLADCFSRYIDSHRGVLSPSTLRGYLTLSRNRFVACLSVPVVKINWQEAVSAESSLCSAKTLKNAWGLVSASLAYSGFPVPGIRLPQVIKPEINWIPPEQIPAFLEAVCGSTCEVGALLALHGLRRSELFALDWGKIDLTAGVIKVRGAKIPDEEHKFVSRPENKTQTSRRNVQIMIPRLLELLAQAQRDGLPIISGSPNTLSHRIKRCCELNGLPPVTAHGLRHSFASLGCHLGIPEGEIAAMGGWNDIATVHKIYEHYSEYQRLQSSNLMSSFFKSANKNANEIPKPLKNQAK